jgi:starch synthase
MYAMRYGTPPVVRSTGGLVDTVDQYEEGRHRGSGFRFELPTAEALFYVIGWACSTFYDRPEDLLKLRQNGMAKDLSWGHSAELYSNLYEWAVEARDWTRAGQVEA